MSVWQTSQLRRFVTCLDGQRIPLNASERAEDPGEYPYWGANGIVGSVGGYLFDEELVLLGEDGAPFGDPLRDVAFLVRGPVWVNNHIHVLRPSSAVDARFLTYALNAVDWPSYISGSTREKLTQDDMSRASIPAPPRGAQRAIADFLDAETARIDALILSEKRRAERARERLTSESECLVLGIERRQPTVNVEMGPVLPVPTTWKSRRNKAFLREVMDLSISGDEELLTVSHITGVSPRADKDVPMFLAEDNVGYKRVQPGDLVVNTMWAWMGALGVTARHGIVSPAYGVYRFTDKTADPGYFDALFRTPAYVSEMTRYSKGVWTSRLRLYPESFLAIASPFPPPDVQRDIAAHLRDRRVEVSRIVELLERSIELLRERRQALITAAVTGELSIPGAAA